MFENYFRILISVIFIVVLIAITYIRHKLLIWKRQQIPFSFLHLPKAYRNAIPIEDQKAIKKFGKIFGTFEMLNPVIFISEPHLINKVLVTDFASFANKQNFFREGEIGSLGLSTLPYQPWKRTRRLLSHCFTTGNIKKMVPIFNESIDRLVKRLDKYSDGNNSLNIKHYIDCVIVENVLLALYGVKIDSKFDTNNTFINNIKLAMTPDLSVVKLICLFIPLIRKLFDMTVFDKQTTLFGHETVNKIIESRKSLKSDHSYYDFVQFLINAENADEMNGKYLSQKEVVDNSLHFFIAAYETTSATICHIITALALNPDIQNKLIKEIDDYFKSNNNETIEELRYLDLCMKETLRLWPAFSRIARVTVEDTYLEHIFLPKGTKVYLPTYSVHRDPENYENPEDFIPERFLPENKYKIKAGSYIPFADGPRNCIGKELAHKQIKLIIVGLLKKFRFIACDELKKTEYKKTLLPMRIQKKVMVKIQKR